MGKYDVLQFWVKLYVTSFCVILLFCFLGFFKIQGEFSAASSVGRDTLDLLNTTVNEINKSLKCFKDSKEIAMNTSSMADLAYRQILTASEVSQQRTN